MQYKRYENESDGELIYRICSLKEEIGSWKDVADVLNDLLGNNFTESAYRKRFQSFNSMYKDNESTFGNASELLDELKEARRELEKEKVKFRDERNEYRRILREQARKESYLDLVKRTIFENVESKNPQIVQCTDNNSCDTGMIIPIFDVHAGIKIKNWFNEFDETKMIERFQKYFNKVSSIRNKHGSTVALVPISEVISGLIHENLRCENNQNLIEQFLSVSDCIANFLEALSYIFDKVNVHVAAGNHSRLSAKKDASLKGENFDHLLIPYLSARLQNFNNINFFDNDIVEDIVITTLCGNKIFVTHGDKDSVSNVVQKLSLMFGIIPDIVYMGHRHFNALSTVGNTKVIQSGSFSGVDNYALDLRCNTRPEQTVSVVDEDGLICVYDVNLD